MNLRGSGQAQTPTFTWKQRRDSGLDCLVCVPYSLYSGDSGLDCRVCVPYSLYSGAGSHLAGLVLRVEREGVSLELSEPQSL